MNVKEIPHDELRSILGEAIHVGWRKGVDHETAHEIWSLIRDMPDEEYVAYVEYILYSLDFMGIQIVRKEDSDEKASSSV